MRRIRGKREGGTGKGEGGGENKRLIYEKREIIKKQQFPLSKDHPRARIESGLSILRVLDYYSRVFIRQGVILQFGVLFRSIFSLE